MTRMRTGRRTNSSRPHINDKALVEELVATLPYFREHPVEFVREWIGVEPDEWQVDFLNAVRDRKFVAVRSCTGAGKDAAVAWLIIWFVICFEDAMVPCTANSEDQLYDVLWTEVKRWLDRSRGGILHVLVEWTKTELRHRGSPDTWKAVTRTTTIRVSEDGSRNAEGIQGFHTPNMLIVIDEASGVDNAAWDALEMTMTHPANKMVVISNPTRITGRFFDIWHKPVVSKRWYKLTVAALNPRDFGIDADVDYITTRPDPEKALQDVEERGAADLIVMAKVFGLHATEATPDTVYSFGEVVAAMSREVDVDFANDDVQIGVDCARFGDDETVYIVRRGFKITKMKHSTRTSVPEIAREIMRMSDEERDPTRPKFNYRPLVLVDETGVGGGVVDICWEAGYYNVIGIEFGSAAYQFEKYENIASEMWIDHLKRMIKLLSLPDDERLRNQLISRRYEFSQDGKRMKIEPKKLMKKRGLGSPDRAEALCLAVMEPSLPAVA